MPAPWRMSSAWEQQLRLEGELELELELQLELERLALWWRRARISNARF